MLDTVKNFYILKTVDKDIKNNNFDSALNKLNMLIQEDFRLEETYLKRARLCHKILMAENAYSDYTHVLAYNRYNNEARYERMNLNFEIANFCEAISDANIILRESPDNRECIRIKINSYILSEQEEQAKNYVMEIYDSNKYRILQFLLTETAKFTAENEFAKALKIINFFDLIDIDNPIKIFNEANIYALAGEKEKENELMKKLDSVFPKYFVSHFRFSDMYDEHDIYEISFLLELRVFDKLNNFAYPMSILEGYKYYLEGHIIDSKAAFEKAISINPNKPDAYVLLGQTLQLMSGYDNPAYRTEAEKNYKEALKIYEKEHLTSKADDMRRQIKHLNSTLSFN